MSATNRIEELQKQMDQLPSERDWDVYQMVRVEQWPTRVAAKEFGISQTRVCQIVQRTADFVAEIAPIPKKEDEARHLAAGKQLAAERVDYLYGEALSCYRTSQGNEKVIHQQSGHGKSDSATIRRNHGDVRYLYAAARLAIMASTLPPPRLSWRAERAEETCSAPTTEQPEVAAEPKAESSATAAAMMGCVEQSRAKGPASKPVARPVQKGASGSKEEHIALRRDEFFQPG